MQLPREPEGLLPYLASLGAAIATGKLLASDQGLSWRAVIGRALEGAGLAMCAGVVFLLPALFPNVFGSLKDVHPIAQLALGGALASLGASGLISVVRAIRGGPK